MAEKDTDDTRCEYTDGPRDKPARQAGSSIGAGEVGEEAEVALTAADVASAVSRIDNERVDRTLDVESQEALLSILKQRFEANMNRHEGIEWNDVKHSLDEADPEKLWSLQQMEAKGHEPDVYMEDDGAYYFGTCSTEEMPQACCNIAFDAKAEALLRRDYPDKTCNGNAVGIVADMGVDLMDQDQFLHLSEVHTFHRNMKFWLKTDSATRANGDASFGGVKLVATGPMSTYFPRGGYVRLRDVTNCRRHLTFCASLKVLKV